MQEETTKMGKENKQETVRDEDEKKMVPEACGNEK